MSARTTTVRRALAQAGEKGLAHLAAQQDTGTWISRCGRQIRSQHIRSWTGDAAGAQALTLGAAFCDECRSEAVRIAGTVADGVAILLSLDPADDSAAQLVEAPVEAIRTEASLREPGEDLIASVQVNGVISPIIARRTDTGLQLVSGGRRLAAARAAGLDTIPTVVVGIDQRQAVVERLLENLHRADLDPIAQAHAYADALEQLGVTQGQLADRLGVSRPQLCNTMRLLQLPEYLRDEVANGALTAQQGRALLRVDDPTEQAELAARVAAEQLTAAETDAVVRARVRRATETAAPELARVADVLAGVLAARVKVTRTGDRARVLLDVPEEDLARLLEQLGLAAAAAA